MSQNMKIFLELAAKADNFRQGMHAGEKALDGFRQYAQKVKNTIQTVTQEIGFLGNAAAALSSGLVLKKLFSVSDYMPVDDALLRMRVNFKNTAEEMDAFKKQLTALAGETGEEQGKVFQMSNKLSLAYKPEDITEIIKQSDRISDATKAPIEASQEGLVQIMRLYKLSAKEAKEVADAIVASRVDLESLDVVMQRLAMRGGTKKDYTETLGFIRGMGKAGIDKPRLIAQMDATLGMLEDKAERLQHNGIKVFDTDANGNRVWRDKIAVLQNLEKYITKIKKTMSREQLSKGLDEVFGPQALAKLEFMFSHLKDFKAGIEDMGKASQIAAERSEAGSQTWEKHLNQIKAHLGGIKNDLSFIYDLAKKPIKFMADSPKLTKAAGYTAAGASVAVLGALAYGNIKNILKKLGKTGVGIAEGKAIEAATGVTPVFVVNMPASGVLDGNVPGTAAKTGGMAKISSWLKNLLPAGLAAGTGLTMSTTGAVLATTTAIRSMADVWRGGSGDNWINDAFNRNLMAIDRDVVKPIKSLFAPKIDEMPLIYNNSYKQEASKKEFVFNFRIDKENRVIGDTSSMDADIKINLLRGNFGY